MENKPGTSDILKKRLGGFEKINSKSHAINSKLHLNLSYISTGKPISAKEEGWRDHGRGNLVNKVYPINVIGNASALLCKA